MKILCPNGIILSTYGYIIAVKSLFLLIYSNMQIISLNMHDTKMSQAEMDSTGKITLEPNEKSLVVTIIKWLWH